MIDLDTSPGRAPPAFAMSRRNALPMLALARQPGPSAPRPALSPARSAARPLTTANGVDGPVVVAMPLRLKSGTQTERTRAVSTGRWAGKQPAMTAFAARTRLVTAWPLGGMAATTA